MKKEILNDFLHKKKLNLSDIEIALNHSTDKNAILFYTSYFEGLGNRNSDIDIYVFLSDQEEFKGKELRRYSDCLGVDVVRVGEVELDIEYWTVSSIKKIVEKLVNTEGLSGNFSELKILLRIYYGLFLENNEITKDILAIFEENNIVQLIENRIYLEARSLYDEAIKMYEVNEDVLALDCARRCIWQCAAFLNSHYGKPNLKEKWISKIFIENNAFGHVDILQDYLNLQIYSNITKDNLKENLLKMFSLIQDMINIKLFE